MFGKDIVFTTTNGTRAITIARAAFRVITGAFINLQAVAGYCVRHKRDVVVLCSGWQDKVNIEDTLFGGALTDVLHLEEAVPYCLTLSITDKVPELSIEGDTLILR